MCLYDVIDDSDVVVLHIGVVAIPYAHFSFPPHTVGFDCFRCIGEHQHTEAVRVRKPYYDGMVVRGLLRMKLDGDGIHMALHLQCCTNGRLFRDPRSEAAVYVMTSGSCLRHDFRRLATS